MAAVALGERSINAAPTPPRRGARGKAALSGYRGAPRGVTNAENTIRTPPSSRVGGAAQVDSPGVGMARFDSLQDLLQKAGYKETRVFTPIATAHANGQGSPPGSGISAREGFKGKASTVGRKAGVQEVTAKRNTSSMGKAAGAWFAAVWGATTAREEPPALRSLPSMFNNNATPPPATSADALKSVQQSLATRSSRGELRQAASSPPTTAVVHDPAPSACVTATSSPILSRTSTTGARSSPRRAHVASSSSPGRSPRKRFVALPRRSGAGSSPTSSLGRNTLWTASLRYRAANNSLGRGAASKSVPARNAALIGTQNGIKLAGGAKSKMRRSLVDAFGGVDGDSPTKAGSAEDEEQAADEADETVIKGSDAAEMRRLRKERREWGESISSLKAFAASSSSTSAKDKAPLPPSSLSHSSTTIGDVSPTKSRANNSGGAPLSDLFARAAAPLVSRDDAVVLRSADCLWPAGGNGLRRMRSVEALERAVASMRTGTTGSSIDATVALANGISSAANVEASADPKSPEVIRAPPALTLTSPTGQSGAQLIDLGAKEFEPRSLSPEQLRSISIVRPPTKTKARSMIPKRSGIYRDTAKEQEEGASSSNSASSSGVGKRGRKRMPKAALTEADGVGGVVPAEPSLMAPRPARQRGRKQRNRSKSSSASSSSSAEEAFSSNASAVEGVAGSHRINALRQQPRPAQNAADDPFVVAPGSAAPASTTSAGRGNVQRNAAKARRNAEAASAVAQTSSSKGTLSRASGRTTLAKSAATATCVPQQTLAMSPETVRAAYGANTDSPSVALAKRSKSRGESRIPVASP